MIARVFPRRTNATPTDALAFIGDPPLWLPEGIERIMVSCTFTWDLNRALELTKSWQRFGVPVMLGGPAWEKAEGDFTPGMFLGEGYTITSRGCPNACPHCLVPKRQGSLVELPIKDGWIVQDDNLLACSEKHIRAVFSMLAQQRKAADLRGLEADRLKSWHVDLLANARIDAVWFAYDAPEDLEPLRQVGAVLKDINLTIANRKARAYVLIGQPGDTLASAEARLWQTVDAGFMPFAMLYRDEHDTPHTKVWHRFQRSWARPAAIMTMIGERECATS